VKINQDKGLAFMYSSYNFYRGSKVNSLYFRIYEVFSRASSVPQEIMSLSFYIIEMLPQNNNDKAILGETRLQMQGNKFQYKSRFLDEICENLAEDQGND